MCTTVSNNDNLQHGFTIMFMLWCIRCLYKCNMPVIGPWCTTYNGHRVGVIMYTCSLHDVQPLTGFLLAFQSALVRPMMYKHSLLFSRRSLLTGPCWFMIAGRPTGVWADPGRRQRALRYRRCLWQIDICQHHAVLHLPPCFTNSWLKRQEGEIAMQRSLSVAKRRQGLFQALF